MKEVIVIIIVAINLLVITAILFASAAVSSTTLRFLVFNLFINREISDVSLLSKLQ